MNRLEFRDTPVIVTGLFCMVNKNLNEHEKTIGNFNSGHYPICCLQR